jgi:hypothetical protein
VFAIGSQIFDVDRGVVSDYCADGELFFWSGSILGLELLSTKGLSAFRQIVSRANVEIHTSKGLLKFEVLEKRVF